VKTLLVILNPRNIRMAVESLEALPCDRVWLRGFTEKQVQHAAWPTMMRDARKRKYGRMVVISDDGRVPRGAWDAVMAVADRGHPVTTGWCNLDLGRGWDISNLVSGPLAATAAETTQQEFYSAPDVFTYPSDEVPTSFHGHALLTMPWEVAERFPFECYQEGVGWSSDYHHSRRLADAKVDIVAARDGFVVHLKEVWNHFDHAETKKLVHLTAATQEVVWEK